MADTQIPQSLVMKAWAKDTWEAGMKKAYFNRFTGKSANDIIQIKEELKKSAGDSINIPLLMNLQGFGIMGDNILEGNEEAMEYRDFDVSINLYRNAVRLQGTMDEQRTQINMRKDARDVLSTWLGTFIDNYIFAALTGVKASGAPYTVTQPSTDRIIYGGNATSEATIGTGDTFSTDIIGKAKRLAMADEDTMIRPVNVDGGTHYVMVIDQFQARDLKNDAKWQAAQQYANIRGEKNPIFSGALGMYDGVIIHECNRVPRTASGANDAYVSHALFMGAQAAVFAEGKAPYWVEKPFDYDNKYGISIGRMFGIKKSAFKYDSVNDTDYGVINVLTSSAAD